MKEAAVHFAIVNIAVIQQNVTAYPKPTSLELESMARIDHCQPSSSPIQQLTFLLAQEIF